MDKVTKNLRKIAQDPNYAKILSGINSRIVTKDDFQNFFDDYFLQKKLWQEVNKSLMDGGLFIESNSVSKHTGYDVQTMIIRVYKRDLPDANPRGDFPTPLVVVISTALESIGQGFAYAAFENDIQHMGGNISYMHYFNGSGIEVGLGITDQGKIVPLDSLELYRKFENINVILL